MGLVLSGIGFGHLRLGHLLNGRQVEQLVAGLCVAGAVLGETRLYGVARKGHFPDCKLCTCATHDVKSRNGAPEQEKWKGESSHGKS